MLASTGTEWQVLLPTGAEAVLARADATIGTLPATPSAVTATARRFLGLPYLWAGTSGFGVDCSGLMHLIYRVHGTRIPRDADAQAMAGTAVARTGLQPADLVFFAPGGTVDHVGMYVGGGSMLHAPQTGTTVRITVLSTVPYDTQYVAARRYLR